MFTGIVVLISTAAFAQDSDGDGCVDSYFDANGACVTNSASIGPETTIGAGVFIGERSTLVGRSELAGNRPVGAGTVIGRRVYIDADHTIGADNTIARAVTAGARLQTEATAALGYASVLGDDVFIGNGAAAGSLVTLGNNTRLESGAVIARGVTIADSDSPASIAGIIGPDVTVGSGFTMSASSRIRKGAQIGDDVTFNGTVRVGRDALIGDGAVLGDGARIGAGAEVTANTHVPDGLVVRRGEVYDDPVVTTIHNTVLFDPPNLAGGCSWNNTHRIQYQSLGAMPWHDCMVAASERGGSVSSNSRTDQGSGNPQAGWAGHRKGSRAMYAFWPSYQTDLVDNSRACVVTRDVRAPSVITELTTSVQYLGDTWMYEDYGSLYYDECMLLASQAGASIITPYTIGQTGDDYWVPSTETCNTYNWIISNGDNYLNQSLGGNERSIQRFCMVGYIREPAP